MTNIHITRDNKTDLRLTARQAAFKAAHTFYNRFTYYQHYSERSKLL